MEKEQESIEIAKKFTKMDFSNPMGWTGYYDTELKELSQAIETVLNMLKENSAEILQKNTELAEKNAEIEKKDKIIDEMIGSFIDLGFGFKYCNNDDRCINDCDKCIKQYFERKASKMLQKGRKNNGTKIKYRNIKYHRRRKQWKIKKLN